MGSARWIVWVSSSTPVACPRAIISSSGEKATALMPSSSSRWIVSGRELLEGCCHTATVPFDVPAAKVRPS